MKTTILLLLISLTINAQKEDIKFAVTNTVTSGVITGVGAMVNKKKTDKRTYGKVFVNAFWKGCVGGAVCQSSKYIAQQISVRDNLLWGWPTNLVSSLGASIMENTQEGRGMFQGYNINIYGAYLCISKNGVNPRIDVLTAISYIYFPLFKNSHINILTSLKTGYPIFFSTTENPNDLGVNFGGSISVTTCNDFVHYTKIENLTISHKFKPNFNSILTHEVIHSVQFNQTNINYKNKYIRINYIFPVLYSINNVITGYNNNFYEKEAEYFQLYKSSYIIN